MSKNNSDQNKKEKVSNLPLLRRHCQIKIWRLVSPVIDAVRLLVEVVHAQFCQSTFRQFLAVGEVVADHWIDW